MGALFEGSGEYDEEEAFRAFRRRQGASRSAASTTVSAGNAAPAAPAPPVSIFTILAELQCVLRTRAPTYQYVTQGEAAAGTAGAK